MFSSKYFTNYIFVNIINQVFNIVISEYTYFIFVIKFVTSIFLNLFSSYQSVIFSFFSGLFISIGSSEFFIFIDSSEISVSIGSSVDSSEIFVYIDFLFSCFNFSISFCISGIKIKSFSLQITS